MRSSVDRVSRRARSRATPSPRGPCTVTKYRAHELIELEQVHVPENATVGGVNNEENALWVDVHLRHHGPFPAIAQRHRVEAEQPLEVVGGLAVTRRDVHPHEPVVPSSSSDTSSVWCSSTLVGVTQRTSMATSS